MRAAHTRRGYSCYIYGMQTSGADRAGADVEYRGVGVVSCGEAGGCFDLYCMGGGVRNPISGQSRSWGGATFGLEDAGSVLASV